MTDAPPRASDPRPPTVVGPLPTLHHTFVSDVPELAVPAYPQAVPQPQLLALNEPLAVELGIDRGELAERDGLAILAGNAIPAGTTPVAMAYAGHQFGGYSPRLGDGRALLLGELTSPDGTRVDLHLKGTGRTPFSRGGDGKAAIAPMLREFLFAEAMHALGIRTGRALAVVATGEHVVREGPVPGAILARIAASHLRVGTFEYAVRLDDQTVVRRLADHAIVRHHPAAAGHDDPYLGLLDAVVGAQASLVAQWMLVGFVHGVLNTDNCTISGETIDYGPCAFMDRYDPATVFSSIDHHGRYAFGNQPTITLWNLSRLAETLLPLVEGDVDTSVVSVTDILETFPGRFRRAWTDGMRTKLGLTVSTEGEAELFDDYLSLLHDQRVDYTSSFRALAAERRGDRRRLDDLFHQHGPLDAWMARWRAALDADPSAPDAVADAMDATNPVHIPRNHLIEDTLAAAESGDLSSFAELLGVVTQPFVDQPDKDRFAQPAPTEFTEMFQTFCGT